MTIKQITERRVTVKGDKVFLTGKVGNKWQMLGKHQWIKEEYQWVLYGPYPELTKELMKSQ